jgi:arylsulfatase A-like enzyme
MTWSRRSFLASPVAAVAAPRRPNVLVFMSDQESAQLPGPVDLPNRRRLERGGLRFTHAFCNTPQCSAARSALLTGLPPHRTGVLTNVDGASLGKPLDPALPTVGKAFRDAGYATGYFGKWHLGNAGSGLAAFGFDHTGGERGDDQVARDAAAWIGAQKGPWLAWVSVLNPHHIYSLEDVPLRAGVRPPVSDLSNLSGKPREQMEYVEKDQGKETREYKPADWLRYRSFYCSLVEKVDANLGTVLGAVGDLDATVVAYTSDHGDALGEHGLPFKGPFMYEEEIRIPLLLRAPWTLQTGESNELITQADLAPRVAALAGVKWSGPAAAPDRDAVLLEYYAKQKWVNPIRTIRTRGWKLNWYDRGNRELYQLTEDPHELRNLAGKGEPMEEKLAARLTAWRPPMLDRTKSR